MNMSARNDDTFPSSPRYGSNTWKIAMNGNKRISMVEDGARVERYRIWIWNKRKRNSMLSLFGGCCMRTTNRIRSPSDGLECVSFSQWRHTIQRAQTADPFHRFLSFFLRYFKFCFHLFSYVSISTLGFGEYLFYLAEMKCSRFHPNRLCELFASVNKLFFVSFEHIYASQVRKYFAPFVLRHTFYHEGSNCKQRFAL